MYEYAARVGASQTAPDGRQTVLSVVNMMQDCSLLWMESEPTLEAYFRDNGIAMLLASRQADFFRYADYGERLRVVTSVYGCKGFFGCRNTFVYDERGDAVAASWSMGVFVSLRTGRPARLPPEIVETITMDERRGMEYLDKKIPLPADGFAALPPIVAEYSDIDFNRHVNNARYIRMGIECLPGGRRCRRLRVEYKSPARQGDKIFPLVGETPEGATLVQLLREDQSPFAIIEFHGVTE